MVIFASVFLTVLLKAIATTYRSLVKEFRAQSELLVMIYSVTYIWRPSKMFTNLGLIADVV